VLVDFTGSEPSGEQLLGVLATWLVVLAAGVAGPSKHGDDAPALSANLG